MLIEMNKFYLVIIYNRKKRFYAQIKKYLDKYYDFVYEVKKEAYKKFVEENFGKWDDYKIQQKIRKLYFKIQLFFI